MKLYIKKNSKRILKVLLIIIFVIVFLCLVYTINNPLQISQLGVEPFVDIKPIEGNVSWKRPECKYMMNSTLKKVLQEYGLNKSNNNSWQLYFPCTYNKMDHELLLAKKINGKNGKDKNKRIFIVNNCDELSGKSSIWKNLVLKFGIEKASNIMPMTYVLSDQNDMKRFVLEYDPKKVYIMKKNIQRQKGLQITRSKSKIINGYNDKYVVAQELMDNCYTISKSKRKINMRFYLLVICQYGDIEAYVHNEGFMYYTKVPYIRNTTRDDPNITTGYIDRKVYEENPLTLGDFRQYLDKPDRDLNESEKNLINGNQQLSRVVFGRIHLILSQLVEAIKDKICKSSDLEEYITFQLFGVDVGLDNNLIPKIIEVNKGPDLGAKDGRDGDVKKSVVRDLLKVLKVLPDYNTHEFIKIYS